MTEEQIQQFFQRIDNLQPTTKALFGRMNANQMVCHCTDQIRMALGAKKAKVSEKVNPEEILLLAKAGKAIPTPEGFGQLEGDGTNPTDFDHDVWLLKEHITAFSELKDNFEYAPHPYLGQLDKKNWNNMVTYHLNHHLKQFGV
ncbi:DUF1569 domain-containing protein [Pontibacter silvestris]|uniref:DUF1569 domain-containing protein n=1 Tax=Pontibacter silvestris TaxID=2305183 RepID=A0ABW4X550_9BACT|nr:DUF1569 domain-containing protein [Pontibacter silvestris]MCC9137032.1 DUF1569 domain-containing protein [Pontibacter silvestris]